MQAIHTEIPCEMPDSDCMSLQGLWQLMWPEQSHLPRLLAAQAAQ